MNVIPFMLLANVMLTGNRILDSVFGQGLQNLFQDGIGAGQVIGGLIVVVVFIVISVKKSAEEEQERKRYSKWQIALVAILVLIALAQELFDMVLSYFAK